MLHLVLLLFSLVGYSEEKLSTCEFCRPGGLCVQNRPTHVCFCEVSEGLYMDSNNCSDFKSYCKSSPCRKSVCMDTFGGFNCMCKSPNHGQKCSDNSPTPGVSQYLNEVHVFYDFIGPVNQMRELFVTIRELGDKFRLTLEYNKIFIEWSATDFKLTPNAKGVCSKFVAENHVTSTNEVCHGIEKRHAYYLGKLDYEYPVSLEANLIERKSGIYGRIDKINIKAYNGDHEEYSNSFTVSSVYYDDFDCNLGVYIQLCSEENLNPVIYPRNDKIILKCIVLSHAIACPYISKMSYNWTFYKVFQPLVAKLIGGPEVTLTAGDVLTLNGSESEDPNHPTKENMMYVWSCDTTESFCDEITTTDPVRKISDVMQPSHVYIFTLKVQSVIEGILPGNTTQKVRVIPGSSFSVILKCNHNCERVNRYEVVRLSVSGSGQEPIDLSANGISIVYTENGGAEMSASAIFTDGVSPNSYIIKSTTLKENALYEFALKDTAGHILSSVTLETNDKPQGGECVFDPSSGSVLLTEFKITCSGYSDKDESTMALLYELFEIKQGTATDTLLAYSYEPHFHIVRLTSSNLKIRVSDMYGVFLEKTFNIPLTKVKFDEKELDALLNTVSRQVLEDGNQPLAVQHILAIVNSVPSLHGKENLVDSLIGKLTEMKAYSIKDVLQVSTAADKLLSRTAREEKDGLTTKSIMATGSLLKKLSANFLSEVSTNKYITMRDARTISRCILSCIENVVISRDHDLVDEDTDPEIYKTNFFQVQKGTQDIINALDDIADSLITVLKTAETPITINSDSMTLQSVVESPESLSQMDGIKIDQSVIKVSSALAKHFSGNNLGITAISMNKNPMWWDPEEPKINSDMLFIKMNLLEENHVKPIHELPEPLDIFLTASGTPVMHISGKVEVPPTEMSLYYKDTYVAVHRLDINDNFGGELTIEFEDITPASELRALLLDDTHPDYDLVVNAPVITSSSSTIKMVINRKDENDFYYLGILPGAQYPVGAVIEYSFKVHHKMCKIWDGGNWLSKTCSVGPDNTTDIVHCRCNHLSVFGSSLFVPPSRVDPIQDISLFLDVASNPYVVVMVAVFLVFYIIVLIWACLKDKKDQRESHILRCTSFKTLQRGQDNWFLIWCKQPLGELQYVHIWHDNYGRSPDWYCDRILIYDLETQVEKIFLVNRWLSAIGSEDKLEYIINPAPEKAVKSWSVLTKENLEMGFRETHLWISVFIRHPRSSFSGSQRLSVAMSMIMANMLVSLMFYGVAKSSYADDPSYSLGIKEIIISIESALITIPITFVIAFCFKKSRPVYDIGGDQPIKTSNGETQPGPKKKRFQLKKLCSNPEALLIIVANAVEIHPLLPASLNETDRRQHNVRKIWFFIAWSLCFAVIITSSFFIMLYGLKLGANKSLLWMTAILLGFFQGIFIAQPIKIAIIALILGLIFKKRPRTTMYTLKGIGGIPAQLRKDKAYMKMLIQLRSQPMYKPLSEAELVVFQAQRKKLEAQKHILFGFIIILFLVVLFIIISRTGMKEINGSSNHIKNLITVPVQYNATKLEQIYSIPMFFSYFKTTLLPAIYANKWYNEKPLDIEETEKELKNVSVQNSLTGWVSDYNSKLVGIMRIRQQRVKENLCLVPDIFSTIFSGCNVSLNFISEDTAKYLSGWKHYVQNDMSNDSGPWNYTSPAESETFVIFGKSGLYYYGGGYIGNLGKTKKISLISIVKLKLEGWIDGLTRAIFIEFNLYNVNLNLFSSVTVVIEKLSNGIFIPKVQVEAGHLIFKEGKTDLIFLAAVVIFIVLQLKITISAVKKISRYGIAKYLSIWTFKNEALIVFVGLIMAIAYLIRIINYSVYVNLFEAADGATFTSFNVPLHHNYTLQICIGIMIMLTGTYLLFLLTYDSESVLIQTIYLARLDAGLILSFSIISMSFISGIAFITGNMLFEYIPSPILNSFAYKIIQKNLLFENEHGFALLFSLYCLLTEIILLAVLIYYYETAQQKTARLGKQFKLRQLLAESKKKNVDTFTPTLVERLNNYSIEDINLPLIRFQVMRMLTLNTVSYLTSPESRMQTMAGLTVLLLEKKLKSSKECEEGGRNENEGCRQLSDPSQDTEEIPFYSNLQIQMKKNEERMDEAMKQLERLNQSQREMMYYLKQRVRKKK